MGYVFRDPPGAVPAEPAPRQVESSATSCPGKMGNFCDSIFAVLVPVGLILWLLRNCVTDEVSQATVPAGDA